MMAIRNLAALPIRGMALILWWLADRLAKASLACGNGARHISGV
jgi:hypothetical protein